MFSNIPPSERPQERLEKLGAEALSDRELLAMLIRSGTAKKMSYKLRKICFRKLVLLPDY